MTPDQLAICKLKILLGTLAADSQAAKESEGEFIERLQLMIKELQRTITKFEV